MLCLTLGSDTMEITKQCACILFMDIAINIEYTHLYTARHVLDGGANTVASPGGKLQESKRMNFVGRVKKWGGGGGGGGGGTFI